MSKRLPAGIIAAVVVVWIASFLPWGDAQSNFFMGGFSQTTTISISAWSSNIRILGFAIPNWLLTFIATAVGASKVMEAAGYFQCRRWIIVSLSVYGLVHAGLFSLIWLSAIAGGTMGIGLLFTLLSFSALIAMSAQKVTSSAHACASPQGERAE